MRKNEFKEDTNITEKQLYFRNYYRKNKDRMREYNNKKKKEYYRRDSIKKIEEETCNVK